MCDAICGLSLLLVLSFASRGFSPGTPVFPSPQKPTLPNSNSTRNQVDEEPLCGCATSKSLFIYLFIHLLCFRSAALRPDHPYSFGGPPDHWPSNQAIRPPQTIRTDPRSDYNRPSSDTTTKSDHPTRSQTTSLDYSASNQHSIPNPLNWYRSGAFFMGWDKGGI